jgi:hypothetical protein
MGQYVVNGEVVDIHGASPTAADVKLAAGSPSADWVMATLAGGQIRKLNDYEALPAEAEELSIVPAFTYGS